MKALLWMPLAALWVHPLLAQTTDTSTRDQEILEARQAKVQNGSASGTDRVEKAFIRVDRWVERLFKAEPLSLSFGELAPGSGFGVGPVLHFGDPTGGRAAFRLSAIGSARQYYRLSSEFSVPHVWTNRLRLDVFAVRADSPSLGFYGEGANSDRLQRTNYRREDTEAGLNVRWKPTPRHVALSFRADGVAINIGPGKDPRYASATSRFSSGEAPGIDVQSTFLRLAPELDLDYRDVKGDPHRGSHVSVAYRFISDLRGGRFSHRRFEAAVEHYVPFLNDKRVIALRARTELTGAGRGSVVPFYFQPNLGGSNDLRGFGRYRFHDNNVLVMNAEYRWEVASGFDMALFADGGKVFRNLGQLDFNALERSAGFGLRFKTRSSVAMRLDTGFSREGMQVWLKFGNIF